jgi:hypothetical protein
MLRSEKRENELNSRTEARNNKLKTSLKRKGKSQKFAA